MHAHNDGIAIQFIGFLQNDVGRKPFGQLDGVNNFMDIKILFDFFFLHFLDTFLYGVSSIKILLIGYPPQHVVIEIRLDQRLV